MRSILSLCLAFSLALLVNRADSNSAYQRFQESLQLEISRKEPDKADNYTSRFIRYAAFGDSWSSGVNYGPADQELEYDYPNGTETCRCRRVNEAWPVQLRDDINNMTNHSMAPEWTHGRQIDLDFVACHASYFDAIPEQLAQLNDTHPPDFATLMIGGNPGGFPDLLFNCIFWPERSKDYGPEYPDPEGECYKAVQRCNENVRAQWFIEGVLRSIALILTEPRIARNPSFKLYVLGYASLFNEEDKACDQWSFGVWPGKKPLLKKALRKEINNVIHAGRELYDRLLNGPLFGDQVQYIDIDHLFDGRRFCEPTLNGTLQQQNEKSWLYNLEWPGCIPIMESDDPSLHELGLDEKRWPYFCRKCGGLLEYGEFVRPFHPKPPAHLAIKDLFLQKLAETISLDPPDKLRPKGLQDEF
ncbi:hypothetical protein NA57DRAFT_55998 [Rhizodiscina lignyota]|uniref:SGNH hydrolase-type esterase domain-containing protein n=1 Tax=Rhizodiscina lignyota TaxID=1504668 RepID=A0A9P4IIT4_9PEZI|nr:hypothetical protein NA57DRAFT_55998 [Rhizodiscina lignyota]